MLQRSTHESPVDVPDIPATVQPGETIDWPDPIAGFEPVAPDPQPEREAEVPAAKTPAKKRATTAAGEEPAS